MNIQKLDPENIKREYGILCQRFYPYPGTSTPFGSTWCVVEPGGRTLPHEHFEGETFFIWEGRGKMEIAGEQAEVEKGDVIYIAN
jgi:mannose-6-phosphate isomerase-like protein (cupin superfamily)